MTYTDADVQHLAEVIAEARRNNPYLRPDAIPKAILDAGYRRAADVGQVADLPNVGWHVEGCQCLVSDGAVLNVDPRCNIL